MAGVYVVLHYEFTNRVLNKYFQSTGLCVEVALALPKTLTDAPSASFHSHELILTVRCSVIPPI